ncbi:competence type IV pilus major pilin ComGC [uncultured Ilumatobacter sp.]|uniref:competence type IV pilus major pilin ComGC n=1 Tax=uncultured Ilumatobacter sp. TaxID=879968 RepID=UPI00374FB681
MNKNQDKGFTLVELLIVIVILGILATVTVFAVRGITTDAQANACNAEIKTVQTAAQAYFASNPAETSLGADADASMSALINAGLLAEASTTASVAPDGTVTSVGDCL